MTELTTRSNDGYLQIAENLLNQMKGFATDIADVKDILISNSKDIEELKNTSEISTNQKNIIKDKVSYIVNRDLTRPNRSRRSIAYSKIYRDMRMYGLASPYERTEKQFFNNINEVLNSYRLDMEYIDEREAEIIKENEK